MLALSDVNYVILATPPRFRAEQLEAAVKAGKHVFMEKPVAVDVPGVLTVMAAGELAKQKGLGIAAGTQRRHLKSYRETIQRIQDGAIGELVYARCYWNGGEIWVIPREEGWSDMEWQIRNWNYFTWLSGDHYVEQHVHNLDIMNWVLGAHPVRAVSGIGGRQVRTAQVNGHVYDHFAVEFEYPGGLRMFSQARQINGCQNKVEEAVVGTKGTSNCSDEIITKRRRSAGDSAAQKVNPYRQEHEDLIASVRAGQPINEAQAIAESTMTGILGREAAYSGKEITWDEAMKSTTRLGPEKLEFGHYPIPPSPCLEPTSSRSLSQADTGRSRVAPRIDLLVQRVRLEILQVDEFERRHVRCRKNDRRSLTGFKRLLPPRRAKTPAVARLEARKAEFGLRCGKVVASFLGEPQELLGHLRRSHGHPCPPRPYDISHLDRNQSLATCSTSRARFREHSWPSSTLPVESRMIRPGSENELAGQGHRMPVLVPSGAAVPHSY